MFGANIISVFVLLCFCQTSNTDDGKGVSDEWQEQVVKKLTTHVTDTDQLIKILFYLGQQEIADGGHQNSAHWKMLKNLLNSNKETFFGYAKQLLQEADKNQQSIRDSMDEVYDHLELQGRKTKTGDLVTIDIGALIGGGAVGFAHIWKHITPEMQGKILLVLPRIKSFAVSTANSAGAAVNIYGGKATIALAAVYLSYEAMRNIHRWWKGEISGRRVAKNIIDSCGTVAAGAGGAMAGAAAGSFFGPVGTVVGGVIGSVVGSAGGGVLIDTLTQELFDIPKDEALERAYNCLGVVSRTTDREINRAFRALSLKYHPDKGGSQQSFLMLQTCMGIIKVARGEEY